MDDILILQRVAEVAGRGDGYVVRLRIVPGADVPAREAGGTATRAAEMARAVPAAPGVVELDTQ